MKKMDDWTSVSKYAKSRGVTRQAIEKHLKSGKIPKSATRPKVKGGKQILINPELADVALSESIDISMNGKINLGDGIQGSATDDKKKATLNDVKIVYWAEKAMAIKRQNKIESGEYLEKAKVEKQSFETSRQIRDASLNMKNRIVDEIAALCDIDPSIIEAILDREVNNYLEVLSK